MDALLLEHVMLWVHRARSQLDTILSSSGPGTLFGLISI